jgi:hypothetical protein
MSPEAQLVIGRRGEQHAAEGVVELDRSERVLLGQRPGPTAIQ